MRRNFPRRCEEFPISDPAEDGVDEANAVLRRERLVDFAALELQWNAEVKLKTAFISNSTWWWRLNSDVGYKPTRDPGAGSFS
jgi:hypothetical protein